MDDKSIEAISFIVWGGIAIACLFLGALIGNAIVWLAVQLAVRIASQGCG